MRIRIAGIARVHAGSHCGSRRRMVRMRIRIAVPQMVRVDVHSHCGDGSCACALGGGMMMVSLGQPCGAHPRARAHARKVHGSARAHRWSAKCRAAHLTTSTSCSHRWRPTQPPTLLSSASHHSNARSAHWRSLGSSESPCNPSWWPTRRCAQPCNLAGAERCHLVPTLVPSMA